MWAFVFSHFGYIPKPKIHLCLHWMYYYILYILQVVYALFGLFISSCATLTIFTCIVSA